MGTQNLYCHNCKKNYNVRNEDIKMMKENHPSFDGKEYTKGCFFKELGAIKRAKNLKKD